MEQGTSEGKWRGKAWNRVQVRVSGGARHGTGYK